MKAEVDSWPQGKVIVSKVGRKLCDKKHIQKCVILHLASRLLDDGFQILCVRSCNSLEACYQHGRLMLVFYYIFQSWSVEEDNHMLIKDKVCNFN